MTLTLHSVLCMGLRIVGKFCFLQHKPVGLYHGGECWLRGMEWLLVWSRLLFFFKRLKG